MQIRTFQTIDAPAELVWSLLVDFAGRDAWDPMLRSIRGRCEEGARVTFQLRLGPVNAPVDAEVLVVSPNRALRWVGPYRQLARRIASGEHYYELTPLGPTQCRLEHGEEFTGALVPRRATWLAARLRPLYEAFNRRLAREAERRFAQAA
jgi:hypothetical protein